MKHPALNSVILHICCGVCASHPVHKLREDGHLPIGYFFNPCIHPKEEYLRRLDTARKAADLLELELLEGPYDEDEWFLAVKGLEDEPEGGKRCAACFKYRLEATNNKAKQLGIKHFTSTLTVSPHKDAKLINETGSNIYKGFLSYDFKKEDGFKKTHEFSKKHGLYCQNYCGCEFSRR